MARTDDTEFHQPMILAGEHISAVLRRCRDQLVPILDNIPAGEKVFGDFPLFMATCGVARMHFDRNDVVSILVLLSSPANSGGGLELGGTSKVLNWEVGDAIILDSADLAHGTRDFVGDLDERIIGLFILHKPLCRVLGVQIE